MIGRKAIHLMQAEEGDGAKKFDLSELHVDIGANDAKDARNMCRSAIP